MTRNSTRTLAIVAFRAGRLRRAIIAAAVAGLLILAAGPAGACEELTRPGPVAPSGLFVDDGSDLEAGQQVLVEWGSQWWSGEVLWADGPQVRIHYSGWETSWDEVVPRGRLQLIKQAHP